MQLEKAIYCMEMLASPGCNTALSGQPVKAAAGASLEVALTGWKRVLPHRKNDWPKKDRHQIHSSTLPRSLTSGLIDYIQKNALFTRDI